MFTQIEDHGLVYTWLQAEGSKSYSSKMIVIPRLMPQKRKNTQCVGIVTNGDWTPNICCYVLALKITIPIACWVCPYVWADKIVLGQKKQLSHFLSKKKRDKIRKLIWIHLLPYRENSVSVHVTSILEVSWGKLSSPNHSPHASFSVVLTFGRMHYQETSCT